ncbi:PREDICTED: UPF0725 protein At5g63820-like [Camelina sativa]|uniref:UPF0725 protein At5g63820-like n=1 Tax=Camelina sativa TaxID=90675 RepID=A0ABM0VTX0_CAMSA|nr:PREDICTED: UPF0725 protein At5g63820-like [Camelina sativa]
MKVLRVTEFGKLEVSKTASERKKEKKLRAWDKKYSHLAYGFDYGGSDFRIRKPDVGDYNYHITLYCRFALYCYNFEKGTNFKFVRWVKYNALCSACVDFYITLEAMDPAACNSVLSSFQAVYSNAGCTMDDIYTWRILACRPSCNKPVNEYWDRNEDAIDQFYTGEMPKWLSDDEAFSSDNKKYYVVQEAELLENEWLHLFIEIAFFKAIYPVLLASPPLEIKKVVVETKEDYMTEAREKLHAENAIFYISYKYKGVSSCGIAVDHRAIIRKTMDGEPEHMCLEIAFS